MTAQREEDSIGRADNLPPSNNPSDPAAVLKTSSLKSVPILIGFISNLSKVFCANFTHVGLIGGGIGNNISA